MDRILRQRLYAAAARSRTVREFEAACRNLGLRTKEYRGPDTPARAIYEEVRHKQWHRRTNPPHAWTPDIRVRLRRYLLDLAVTEIRRRGLATLLVPTNLVDYDPKSRVWLVGADERVGSRASNWWYHHRWLAALEIGAPTIRAWVPVYRPLRGADGRTYWVLARMSDTEEGRALARHLGLSWCPRCGRFLDYRPGEPMCLACKMYEHAAGTVGAG